MTSRALTFTTGSPFARAVRIALDELGLDYKKYDEITTPTVAERARVSPTLQVPAFWDGKVNLWGSDLIVEYLLEVYSPVKKGNPPMCGSIARPETFWGDKLVLTTVQTLGTAATTISQMKWGGVSIDENDYLRRSADRIPHLLQWLEKKIGSGGGFIPGFVSAQDIFLACHLGFILNRPLGIDPMLDSYPKISNLLGNLNQRKTFKSNPILWWEPGVIGYDSDGVTPIYQK